MVTKEERAALIAWAKSSARDHRDAARRHETEAERARSARRLTLAENERDAARGYARRAETWAWLATLLEAADRAAEDRSYTESVIRFLRESAESDRETRPGEAAKERAEYDATARGADAVADLIEAAIGKEVRRG